jgi:predicted DNA-binding protein
MEDINIKSIRYPVAVDEKLEKLAVKLGRTKKQFFIQMVDYFYKSKKDPADLNDEALKKELVNGVNRIIAFIRRQENDFLMPTFTDISNLITIINAHTKFLKGISQYLLNDEAQTKQILMRMALLDKAIAKTQNDIDEKALLKSRFKKVLEYYISQRESLGWPVSAAKKEELQTHVRQSLENL